MKIKSLRFTRVITQSKMIALAAVVFMLLMQVPFSAFSADEDIRADLLSPNTLPDGRVEVTYNANFNYDYSQFNNGFNQYSWSIIEGALPPGLTLYPTSGPTWQPWINGTPTEAGTYTFTIKGSMTKYVNGENVPVIAAIKTYTLTILPPYPLEISDFTLYHGYANQSYSVTLEESRWRTVSWSMELANGGALPDGLSIGSDTGKITWESPVVGKYNLKITATRGEESVSKELKLIIESEGGCKHTQKTKTTRKAATCKENGLLDYWSCPDCEYFFADEACKHQINRDVDELYTTAFHSDKNGDNQCDTCQKTMPIFKKVTNENEITSCGMYLVVSKIGDKYYTFKTPESYSFNYYMDISEVVEIEQNTDGSFSYFEPEEVLTLKTEPAAECRPLDAGLPRYNLMTTINNMPYILSSDDYSGSVYLDSYGRGKYGFRMALPEGGTPAIASVYAEYWGGGSGKGGSGILTAFEVTKGSEVIRFFSFGTEEAYETNGLYINWEQYEYDTLNSYPIELYKLTYAGEANGTSYTVSDAQSLVTIDNRFEAVSSAAGNGLSTVGGISEALKTDYVEDVVLGDYTANDTVSIKTYANINLTHEVSSVGADGTRTIGQLSYEITPQLEIKTNDAETSIVNKIDDKYFDGSTITLSLCVGSMTPQQIIHYKTDGTKEYFYDKDSEQVKNGSKSFQIERNPSSGEGFVQFEITSFSTIKILSEAETESQSDVYAAEIEDIYLQLPVGYNQNHIWGLGASGFRRNIDVENVGNRDIYMGDPQLIHLTPATDKIYISWGSVPNNLSPGNISSNYYVDFETGLAAGQYTATIQFMDRLNKLPQPVTANLTVVVGEVGIKQAYQSGTKAKAEVGVLEAGDYTVLFVDYEGGKLNAVASQTLTVSADQTGIKTVESAGNITIGKGDKVMVLNNLQALKPLCAAYVVKGE